MSRKVFITVDLPAGADQAKVIRKINNSKPRLQCTADDAGRVRIKYDREAFSPSYIFDLVSKAATGKYLSPRPIIDKRQMKLVNGMRSRKISIINYSNQ